MNEVWLYVLSSVLVISLLSFVGVLTFAVRVSRLKTILIYLISFSAGALFGDAFLHLLPEAIGDGGIALSTSFGILGGIVIFFVLEKIIHWQHCHMPITTSHVHSFAYMNIIGDGLHNFIDGVIIAASYLVNVQAGIATTLAVALHEIPQEIGDFGVLLHGGFSKTKALILNFVSALAAIVGAIITLWVSSFAEQLVAYLVPVAVGGFIYIAGSDLIPELHKENTFIRSVLQVIAFLIGILVMAALLTLE
ncbi:ZIP family metal transporter [Candidatus Pacearchaeota archaeon]|nr:ZIP family metal transporter [Candidatus Pacearchaeota archaeon]